MGERRERPVAQLATEMVLSGEQIPGRRLGVVIVGGGMAGVGPGGMVTELEANGVLDVVQGLYGNSGGGIGAACAAARQAAGAIKIYYEHVNSRSFINLSRLPASLANPLAPPAVDVRYLTEHVMVHENPLDTEAVKRSPIPVFCSATDAITGENVDFDLSKEPDGQKIRTILRAGATLPVLAGPPVQLRGRFLYDGGVKNSPIGVEQAVNDGCTDILILHNGMEPSPKDKLTRMGARLLKNVYPKTSELLDQWPDVFHEVLEWIKERAENPSDNPTPQEPNIQILVPGVKVSMLEKSKRKLIRAAEAGKETVREHFPTLTEIVYQRKPHYA